MGLDALDEAQFFRDQGGQRGLEEVLDRILASEVVDAALSRLTDDEREALLLRYVEGFSVREIAGLMKRTDKGVESLLMRAKAKPRDFLLRMLGEEVGP
jgi:RNA polymerase sigma factor (sigma-70 family)